MAFPYSMLMECLIIQSILVNHACSTVLGASGASEAENTCASRQLKLGNHLQVAGKFVLRLTPVDLSGLPEGFRL